MSSTPEGVPWLQRLGEQMQALSEVTETLTLRLLEVEERLAASESEVRSAGASGDLQQLMARTERRLSRLEQLLSSVASPSDSSIPTPRLQVLHAQPPVAVSEGITAEPPLGVDSVDDAGAVMEMESAIADEPFPDDGEQPFMDELIA